MVGTFAMSAGVLVSGLPEFFVHEYGLSQIESIKPLFLLYSIIGLAVLGIYCFLSTKVEIQINSNNKNNNHSRPLKQILTPKSKQIISKLSSLFALDSFAGGFVIQSIVSLWFFTKFGVDLTTLSYIFSIAGVLTAFSYLAAAKMADRIGLINTMVFTHIPSNILLILVAFAPTFPLPVLCLVFLFRDKFCFCILLVCLLNICGMVIHDNMESLEPEWRTFSDLGMTEISKKVRAGRPISLALYDMGLSTQISYSNLDAKGDAINATQTPIIKRIRRWDKISSFDNNNSARNLKYAFEIMSRIKDKLSLTDVVIEKAAYIYRRALVKKLIQGRSTESMVAEN
jgi:hypothetical protein